MKRLLAFLGIVLILVGVRIYGDGVINFSDKGTLTVFSQTEFNNKWFLPSGKDSYRIDLIGSENVQRLLQSSNASVQFTEMEGNLIYAFSPLILRTEWIHGKKVNLMIYVNGDKVSAGVPILKGSY